MNRNRILALAFAVCALGAAIAAAVASAHHVPRHWHHHPSPPPHHYCPLTASPDTYSTGTQATLAVEGQWGVLANDCGNEPTIVANTEPAAGSLELEPNGGFVYTPNASFKGTDSFSYTIADAVHAVQTTCRRSAPTKACRWRAGPSAPRSPLSPATRTKSSASRTAARTWKRRAAS